MPEVTVIIPTHNRQKLLPATLDSVLAQTFPDWECLIVDDHSQDDSVAVAQEYAANDPRFKSMSIPEGKRYANAARNYGLSHASGCFINFLDSDDLLLPQKLARQLEVFAARPELDTVTCRFAVFHSEQPDAISQVPFAPRGAWIENLLRGNALVWQTACPLWRKEVFTKIGVFDERLTAWQDRELDIRALTNNLQLERLEEILMLLRRSDHQRMGARSDVELFAPRCLALTIVWNHLVRAKEVTEPRRLLAAQNIYAGAWAFAKAGRLRSGLKEWFHYGRYLELRTGRILAGAIVLVLQTAVRRYPALRFLNPLERRARQRFFRFRKQLPDPLPDLDSIPTYSPVPVAALTAGQP